jgi:hypothetical protein
MGRPKEATAIIMPKLLTKFIILAILAGSASELLDAQVTQSAPDCRRDFTFTAVANGATLANYGPGSPDGGNACTVWLLAYAVASTGTVTSLSLDVESAPPGTTETVPGTWVTYTGTVDVGINPNTSITGAQTQMHNAATAIPFIRVALTALSATGTTVVYGVLMGWNEGNAGGGGGGGGCVGTISTPCVVDGPDASGAAPTHSPVLVAGSDGTDVRTVKTDNQGRLVPGAYPNSTPVTLTSSGLTQLIAASGATVITIGSYSISFNGTTDFQLEYGTGVNCGTGTTALTGLYKTLLTIAIDDPIQVPASQAVCANLGSAVTGGGVMMYNQQ